MHLPHVVSHILAVVALATSVVAQATVTSTTTSSVCPSACASDNCFRQLASRTASASPFCHTFTTATTTAVTGFPTYLSTSCGVARASSVCSCLWPAAPTTSPPTTTTAAGTVTVVSMTTVVACPSSLNLLSHGSNPCLSPWTSYDEIIENNVGNYTLQTVRPAGAPSTDGACKLTFNNTADQQGFSEYEFTHFFTLPSSPHAYTLAFWAAAADAVSAGDCYIIAAFASQSNEHSFGLSTAWQQYVFSYVVDPSNAGGWVAIVVTCDSSRDEFEWAVILDQVQFFQSRP